MNDDIEALRKALQTIATEGDALSGPECQEIAAAALGIPVPKPPRLPPPRVRIPQETPAPFVPGHIEDRIAPFIGQRKP